MNFRIFSEPLWDWDECLYAVNAREMHETGHFLTNIWNGYLDFQKPPGYTWLLQIPYSFGINEFSVRVLSLLFGILLIIAVYFFSKKYFSTKVAILASLILLSSELIVIYSQHADTDIGYTLLIFLGFWTWILSLKNYRFSFLSGLIFGLAVMMKGIGSITFLGALFLSIFLNFKKGKFINFLRLSLVSLLVIAPWHIIMYAKYGFEFFRVYILENIVKRSQFPIEFHRERWWFYFTLLYKELFPWILFTAILPLNYILNIKKFLSFKKILKELKEKELLFTILILIIVPLISLIRFKTKIAWYAMPLYPFLVIYLAYCIDFLFKKIKFEKFIYVLAILIALDASQLLINESLLSKNNTISPKDEVVQVSNKYPHQELNYLVPFGERQAREILPPEEQIPQTWVFGGHPCAVDYSHKKVNYYYFIDEFKKDLNTKEGLFLIPNADSHLIENTPIKELYKNSEFTLFEKIN